MINEQLNSLGELLFLKTESNILPFINIMISAVKKHQEASVENSGEFFLDRAVGDNDLAFMKNTLLANIEFVLPTPDDEANNDEAKFFIQNSLSNDKMQCSNRPSAGRELRGNILRKMLVEQQTINDQQTLYSAMQNIIKPSFSQSDSYLYFITPLKAEYNELAPFLAVIGDAIDTQLGRDPKTSNEKLLQLSKAMFDNFKQEIKGKVGLPPIKPDNRSGIKRWGKTLGFGLICLAVVIVGAALTATGVFLALGIPTLFAVGAIGATFLAGGASATKIIAEEIKHRQAWRTYEIEEENHQLKEARVLNQVVRSLVVKKPDVVDTISVISDENSASPDSDTASVISDETLESLDKTAVPSGEKIKRSYAEALSVGIASKRKGFVTTFNDDNHENIRADKKALIDDAVDNKAPSSGLRR